MIGFTADDQVLFSYRNEDQDFEQSFGINLKKYMAHQAKEPLLWRSQLDFVNLTESERQDRETSEGVYTFLPQWDDQLPHLFGKLVQDISYQRGDLVEQITITFQDPGLQEYALVKVRFSPHFQEVIEFDVELSPIPVGDFQGKDVTVNWKFFNGLDPQGQFWTDSNGLEM